MVGNGEAKKEAIRPDFNRLMVFWALPKQISALKRENLIENWQIGMRNWFFGKSVD
jgi:hypothetical protein